ncbi:hypothetical protein CYY_006515 [Polysphondylium violaceum]|uniref:Ankyrin repeat-containing protein n=1 Tax=Polysphondylium violaceum TaxID=133409 RepID=A0A8J4PRS2_9MYCE|nr:hypothetical protein CYY_006515 [Polysphondylium violaceum]
MDTNNSNREILFFQIFKNVAIKHYIFKFLKTTISGDIQSLDYIREEQRPVNYKTKHYFDRSMNQSWLVENKHFNLLIDKMTHPFFKDSFHLSLESIGKIVQTNTDYNIFRKIYDLVPHLFKSANIEAFQSYSKGKAQYSRIKRKKPLLDLACRAGNVNIIEFLISKGYKSTDSALKRLVKRNHLDAFKLLLSIQRRPLPVVQQTLLLNLSILKKHFPIVDYLIERFGIGISTSQTLLNAISVGNKELIKKLVSANEGELLNNYCMYKLAEFGDLEIVQSLLESRPFLYGPLLLDHSFSSGNFELVHFLESKTREHRLYVTCRAIDFSASKGDMKMLQHLYNNYPVVSCSVQGFIFSLKNNQTDAAIFLFEHYGNALKNVDNPFKFILMHQNVTLLKYFLEKAPQFKKEELSSSVVFKLIKNGNLELIKIVVEQFPLPDYMNWSSILFQSNIELIEYFLLQRKVHIDIYDLKKCLDKEMFQSAKFLIENQQVFSNPNPLVNANQFEEDDYELDEEEQADMVNSQEDYQENDFQDDELETDQVSKDLKAKAMDMLDYALYVKDDIDIDKDDYLDNDDGENYFDGNNGVWQDDDQDDADDQDDDDDDDDDLDDGENYFDGNNGVWQDDDQDDADDQDDDDYGNIGVFQDDSDKYREMEINFNPPGGYIESKSKTKLKIFGKPKTHENDNFEYTVPRYSTIIVDSMEKLVFLFSNFKYQDKSFSLSSVDDDDDDDDDQEFNPIIFGRNSNEMVLILKYCIENSIWFQSTPFILDFIENNNIEMLKLIRDYAKTQIIKKELKGKTVLQHSNIGYSFMDQFLLERYIEKQNGQLFKSNPEFFKNTLLHHPKTIFYLYFSKVYGLISRDDFKCITFADVKHINVIRFLLYNFKDISFKCDTPLLEIFTKYTGKKQLNFLIYTLKEPIPTHLKGKIVNLLQWYNL